MAQRIYTPQAHAFFDNLVSFIASVTSLGMAFEVQASHPVHPFTPNQYLALAGLPAVAGCEFHIYAGPVLVDLLANRWPVRLVIDEAPISQVPPKYQTWLTGLQGVHGSMISSAFVQYFEANRSRAAAKYGTNPQGWSSTWNFGRVVRNAFAHGGVINITSATAPPVTWRGLSYGSSQNGRQLLYQDLTPVELIILMEDMDGHL